MHDADRDAPAAAQGRQLENQSEAQGSSRAHRPAGQVLVRQHPLLVPGVAGDVRLSRGRVAFPGRRSLGPLVGPLPLALADAVAARRHSLLRSLEQVEVAARAGRDAVVRGAAAVRGVVVDTCVCGSAAVGRWSEGARGALAGEREMASCVGRHALKRILCVVSERTFWRRARRLRYPGEGRCC